METAIAIHGGAGLVGALPSELEAEYHAALFAVLSSGRERVERGDPAVDVGLECVRLLEDNPLFNAGRGSVLTADASVEMDACVMDGSDLSVGALAAIRGVRNPILGANALRLSNRHVLLCREGAEAFCREQKIPFEPLEYFLTPLRLRQLERAKAEGRALLDHDGKYGTVGAVCRDRQGRLAAATSTGGLSNKLAGRIGDSPIPGAGAYADNRGCAVSATGQGEALMRILAAGALNFRVKQGQSLEAAANAVIFEELPAVGGSGGLIAVDYRGEIVTPYNTGGMFRGVYRKGRMETGIGSVCVPHEAGVT